MLPRHDPVPDGIRTNTDENEWREEVRYKPLGCNRGVDLPQVPE